jgi:hypothetical protein
MGDRTYFVGHTPGVFSALAHMGVGSVITYWDGRGVAHPLAIAGRRSWRRADGRPPLVGGATTQFQTCETSDRSIDLILTTVAA